MAGVRNGVLGRITAPAPGAHTVFTVPSNYVALLKSVLLTNVGSTGTPSRVTFALISADRTIGVFLADLDLTAGQLFEWSGWTALMPGDYAEMQCDQAGIRCWTAGALLPGVPTNLPLPVEDQADPIELPIAPVPPPMLSRGLADAT